MGDLKYGHLRGGQTSIPGWQMTASETIKDKSGRFVTRNVTTGYIEIADTTEDIFGWVEAEEKTSVSGDVFNVIVDTTAVFRMPLIYDASTYTVNYSAALMGETCDPKVSGGVQYCNPTAATNNSFIIVGGQAATGTTIGVNDGYVDVMMNVNAMHALAVGA